VGVMCERMGTIADRYYIVIYLDVDFLLFEFRMIACLWVILLGYLQGMM